MSTLNSSMTFKELAAASSYQDKISKYIFVNGDTMPDYDAMTLGGMAFENGRLILQALQSLEDAHDAGCDRDYKIYSEEEIRETPSKGDVRLFFFPGKKDAPYVLLVPGGAYVQVWSWTEGFESAMEFNKNDINAFVLSYRVNVPGLLPDPVDDIAAAVKFITAHDFPVNKNSYTVCGFSAGAHATSVFGSSNRGFRNYDIPSPEALFLIYPVISTDILYDEYKASGDAYEQNLSYVMLQRIGGNGFTRESLEEFNAIKNCDNYPPTFLIHGEADDLVDPKGTEDLHKALEAKGIRHHYETVPGTGHGFSAGKGSAADGWIERAIDFWKSLPSNS